jgi:hypothetical protein
VRELIRAAGADVVFLPPFSPDFNPIEKAFAKLKAILRNAAERTVDALWNTIGRIVGLFSPQECANYFAACGYDADLVESALRFRPAAGGIVSAFAPRPGTQPIFTMKSE